MTNDQPQYGAGNGYQQDQAQAPYGQQPYPQYTQNAAGAQRAFTQQPYMDATAAYAQDEQAQHTSVTRVYFEMFLGILVTAVVAGLAASQGWLEAYTAATGRLGFWGLLIAQFIIVVVLSSQVMKMPPAVARVIFYLYAASMGFTLSTVFYVYTLETIGLALGMSSLFFFVLSMIGLTTKRNLLKFGTILTAALITLIVVEVLLLIFRVSSGTMIISGISLLLFAGFTMYDAQATRAILNHYQGQPEMIKRVSIVCALNLYLDFINFFVNLLTLLGGGSRN